MVVDSSCDSLSLPFPQSSPAGPAFLRPFPPPALENVPLPYILDQLHNLAAHYWDKPDTADCTVVIPLLSVPRTRQPSITSTNLDFNDSTSSALNSDPAGLGAAGPSAARVTRMTSKLHLDYLLAQSSLFRNLFSGRPPLEHLSLPALANTSISVPPQCLPRFVPCETSQPTVYLPVPHPQSFPHLVHYMYFGTTELLEGALDQKIFRWEDVVRNVEFLGMRSRIKVFLGQWYARWRNPGGSSCRPFPEEGRYDSEGDEYEDESSDNSDIDSEADSDVDFSDADMDDEDAPTTYTSDDNLDIECSSKSFENNALRSHRSMGVLGDDDDDVPRGRTRTRTVPSTPVRSPRRTRF